VLCLFLAPSFLSAHQPEASWAVGAIFHTGILPSAVNLEKGKVKTCNDVLELVAEEEEFHLKDLPQGGTLCSGAHSAALTRHNLI